MTLSI